MMFNTAQSTVSIAPLTSEMEDYEILLSNIRPMLTVPDSGVFVTAGQVLLFIVLTLNFIYILCIDFVLY